MFIAMPVPVPALPLSPPNLLKILRLIERRKRTDRAAARVIKSRDTLQSAH